MEPLSHTNVLIGLNFLIVGDLVMDMFVGKLHARVIRVDAADKFLGHLAGVSEPEAKRKMIGREFVEVFKAEVRELGVALGLPHDMVYRHPFPGPGLGVRILGEVKKEYADLLRRADAIFIEELRSTLDLHSGKSWYDLTSQAFTVFLPVKSVGVMGDGRTYDYVVALRAVQTSDFMTADWAELPYALLKKFSSRIINEVSGINRVTDDVSSNPPATIEWEYGQAESGGGPAQPSGEEDEPCCFMIESRPVTGWPGHCMLTRGARR